MYWVLIAGKSDSRERAKNLSLRKERGDSRSTRIKREVIVRSNKGENWLIKGKMRHALCEMEV